MSIYIDELFIINLVACLFLIELYSSVFDLKAGWKRRLAAAAFGGAVACIRFLFSRLTPLALAAEAAVPVIAFGKMPVKKVLLLVLIKYAFSGLAVPAVSFFGGSAAIIRNGTIYFDISPRIFIVVFLICGALSMTTAKLLRLKRLRHFYTLVITKGGRNVKIKALYDSGNLLKNPYDGTDVVIAEKETLEGLELTGFVLIPYRALGTENGLLKAFKADKIYCVENGKTINNVTVGLSEIRLSKNGGIKALIGPGFFKEES
ncbi:MAG: sigma-E processing peptidase SpoIIGA [bacterium]|nr:sigma-E processing peptidase SpoIIGA [bacterium]